RQGLVAARAAGDRQPRRVRHRAALCGAREAGLLLAPEPGRRAAGLAAARADAPRTGRAREADGAAAVIRAQGPGARGQGPGTGPGLATTREQETMEQTFAIIKPDAVKAKQA